MNQNLKSVDPTAAPPLPSPNAPMERRAYKLSEAAKTLGISQSSVRRLINRGEIKPLRHLRHILISAVELDRLLSQ